MSVCYRAPSLTSWLALPRTTYTVRSLKSHWLTESKKHQDYQPISINQTLTWVMERLVVRLYLYPALQSARTLYALHVLRTFGLSDAALQEVHRSVVVDRMLYTASALHGFTNESDRQRVIYRLFLQNCMVTVCQIYQRLKNFRHCR